MNEAITFESLPKAVAELKEKLDNIEMLLLEKEKKQQADPERLLTIKEAAQFLKLTVPTLYSKSSKGELPVMKRGKRLYFSSIELMEYLKEGRKKSNAEIEVEAKAYLLNSKRKGYHGK